MKIHRSALNFFLCGFAFLVGGNSFADQQANSPSLEEQVTGLWIYSGLTTGDGKNMPLTGIFLFKDGVFVQQAVFDGTPFEAQGSMAHAGPYMPAEGSVHLIAAQTISTAPEKAAPLSFRSNTEHDVTVTRSGDDLTLIFGMGTSTVQNFKRIGPGDGELYSLPKGALAFVDGYFILVDGDESGVVTGYGTYERTGDDLNLNIIRWAESDGSTVINLRDSTMGASFDGQAFTLEDGRSFQVNPGK